MGFNKKIINRGEFINRFRLKGYQGVIDYIGKSDVFIGLDDDLSEVLEIVYCDTCDTNKNLQIKNIIDGK